MQEHPKKIFIEIICLLEYCVTPLRLSVTDLITLAFRVKDKAVKRKLTIAQIWSSNRREKGVIISRRGLRGEFLHSAWPRGEYSWEEAEEHNFSSIN